MVRLYAPRIKKCKTKARRLAAGKAQLAAKRSCDRLGQPVRRTAPAPKRKPAVQRKTLLPVPGRLFKPTWIHSDDPPGPCPGPPTPTHPATCPLSTIGGRERGDRRGDAVPRREGLDAGVRVPEGPHAPLAPAVAAVTVQHAAASAAESAVRLRRGGTTSWVEAGEP